MIPLSSALSPANSGGITKSEFTWSRTCGRRFELKLNGEVVGTLQRPSFWSSSFLADAGDGHWIFRRTGCLTTGAEILDAATQQPVAQFKQAWGGRGTLALSDGQTFYLDRSGWWRPVWSVTTESGQVVFQLHMREKTVELPDGKAVTDSRLPMLILFALCRIQLAEEDASVAVIVAAS
jgi:hypothetical protein